MNVRQSLQHLIATVTALLITAVSAHEPLPLRIEHRAAIRDLPAPAAATQALELRVINLPRLKSTKPCAAPRKSSASAASVSPVPTCCRSPHPKPIVISTRRARANWHESWRCRNPRYFLPPARARSRPLMPKPSAAATAAHARNLPTPCGSQEAHAISASSLRMNSRMC
jgi:hypothetical protein